jgi:hypothetical protein
MVARHGGGRAYNPSTLEVDFFFYYRRIVFIIFMYREHNIAHLTQFSSQLFSFCLFQLDSVSHWTWGSWVQGHPGLLADPVLINQ